MSYTTLLRDYSLAAVSQQVDKANLLLDAAKLVHILLATVTSKCGIHLLECLTSSWEGSQLIPVFGASRTGEALLSGMKNQRKAAPAKHQNEKNMYVPLTRIC
jgi:hypothetical protein